MRCPKGYKISISRSIEIKLRDGREEVRSLKKMGKYARPACLYCMDYSADNADIGFGGIGLDKWTYTVIRLRRDTSLATWLTTVGLKLRVGGISQREEIVERLYTRETGPFQRSCLIWKRKAR